MPNEIIFSTWNVNKTASMFELVMNHYDWGNTPIICWISETPEKLPSALNGCQIIQPDVEVNRGYVKNHGVFLISKDIQVQKLGEFALPRVFAQVFCSTRYQFDNLAVCGVHLYDQWNYGDLLDRASKTTSLTTKLKAPGAWVGATQLKWVILGDFNMEPFDEPMTLPLVFCSSKCRHLVEEKGLVEEQGVEQRLFYNPAWLLLSNADSELPQGTYFYSKDKVNPWKILDQILLSDGLTKTYVPSSVRVLTSINGVPLVKRSNSSASRFEMSDDPEDLSDHLPIELKVKITDEFSENRHG